MIDLHRGVNVREIYQSLSYKEKALVWTTAIAGIVLTIALLVDYAGIVAAAQIEATMGTLVIAGLAFAQVREMRQSRLAQERPHVIVDTDHSKRPDVYVVLRNIGKGAAKDITFEFSVPMEMPRGDENPLLIPVNEQPYFKHGMDYLAPGAEIPCFWGSMIELAPLLRERGLQDGITITSRYKSITGEPHKTEWTVNPLLLARRII